MAEEQNWQEASNHSLCANNCGFFGSPTKLNLCSKCYNDIYIKEEQTSTAKLTVDKSLSPPSQVPETSSSSFSSDPSVVAAADVTVKSQPKNRCGSCRRRVGLTGFTCRCGTTFCGTHRYPEKHGCTFDYKTMGKEAIAKANPVVKAAKLEKI